MGNENENSYKTSITVKIAKKHLNAWKKVPKPSGFVNSLISDYFNDGLAKLSLPDDVLERYNTCATKEYIVNKLLIEYFRDNVLFVDDFVKINTLQKAIGIKSSNDRIDLMPINKLNKAIVNEEVEKIEQTINSMPTAEHIVKKEVSVEKVVEYNNIEEVHSEEVIINEGSLQHNSNETEPLQNDNIQSYNKTSEDISIETSKNNKSRNILFSKK